MNTQINAIFEKSILKFVEKDKLLELLECSEERKFPKLESLSTKITTRYLPIVLEGQVDVIDKNTQSKIETMGPGKSLELATLLNEKRKWAYDWIAVQATTVLLLPFDKFSDSLSSDYLTYLKIISQQIELQKFKNDMRLLGLEDIKVRDLVLNLKKTTWEDARSTPGSLFLISSGTLEFFIVQNSVKIEIAKFGISDYLIAADLPQLEVKASEDISGWVLYREELEAATDDPRKFSILDILTDRYNEVLQEQVEKPSYEEDDDFHDEMTEQEDKDVEFFYATEAEKKDDAKKKPVIFLQHDMMDCGAACMSMISNYYGRKINIATWRSLLHVTREGASMLSIKRGAEKVGYDCIGVAVGFKGLALMKTPFIALMAYHYVVVYKVNEDSVLLADPEKGLVTMPKDDFINDFSKNIIALRPNEKLQDFPESKSAYRKYGFLVWKEKKEILEIVAYSTIVLGFTLVQPVFLQFIFDNVLFEQNKVGLHIFAGIAIGVNIILGGATFARKSLSIKLTNVLNAKLSALLFRHILKLPLNYFALRNVGDITSRMDELDKIREYISEKAVNAFINMLSLVIYALVLYIFHPYFFFTVVLCITLIVMAVKNRFKEMKGVLQETFAANAKNTSVAYEQISSLKTIKSLSGTLAARWRWEESLGKMLKQRQRFQKMVANLILINSTAQQAMTILFLVLSVYLYMSGKLSLGQIVAVNAVVGSVIRPLISLVIDWDDFDKVKISLEKIDELVTSKTEQLLTSGHDNENGPLQIDEIEFRDVWFRYGGDFSPWIIKGLNLKIKRGDTVAFIGSSGSGKSTVAYMLNLLYEPTKGEILVNGKRLQTFSLTRLRNSISVILQEHATFTGTVMSNIALGDVSADFKKVIKCAGLADAHTFISGLPSAYLTELGDGKQGLSGGQYQRINIARALYRNPEILILDEATSALDTLTEKIVMKNIKEFSAKKTTVIIAHRLNTIQHANKIVLMKNGKIIEQGDHESLLAAQGAYYSMYKKQLH